MALPTKVLRIAHQDRVGQPAVDRKKQREKRLLEAYGSKASNPKTAVKRKASKDVLRAFGVSTRKQQENQTSE